ncbi:methyltransferase domain-containing protein [Gulosibacter macacae]|uniref:Methyltransferase domain-containing protein n=1 Tax=Gulosibacter macacae TaxID=2488791 RepID=A0A3P3W172_9MICO|nr:methyltransferase domain-containing protein [Gulosibacter macacae]
MRDNIPVTFVFDDPADAPISSDQALLDRIRATLIGANFTVDGVEEVVGAEAAAALHRDLLAPAEFALESAAPDGLAGLIRVYLLAQPVSAGQLPIGAAEDHLAAGLLEPVPGKMTGHDGYALLRARVDLRPYAVMDASGTVDLFVASDLGGVQIAADRPLRRDHVVGIGPATTNLAQLTPRDRVGRALDLGVGMGVQTMHLLAHVDHVVATDISERALAFARFNLLINAAALGLDPANLEARVELRRGDLLEPVRGETFDLIVSNPPFVITPRRDDEGAADQYTYRDGGRPGDRLVEDLIRGLGEVLAPDGIAVMLGNWEIHEQDASWHSRLESWPGDEVDLWVIQRERARPIEYADMWLRDAQENRELTSWREQFARYLDDFTDRQVDSVGMGMLLLHRPGSEPAANELRRPIRRFETLEHQLEQPLGARIRDAFSADDWLRAHRDADLSDETFVVAGDVTEERHLRPGDEHPTAMLLRQGGGFRRTFPESTELAAFVSVCDGELTAGQIIAALSGLLEIEDAVLGASLLRDVRDLVALGFLVPAWT